MNRYIPMPAYYDTMPVDILQSFVLIMQLQFAIIIL